MPGEQASSRPTTSTLIPRRAVRSRRRRALATAVLAVAGSWLLALMLCATGPLRTLELKTYDVRFLLAPRRAPPPGIALVLVDPATEARLTEPRIFWQPYFARLLRAVRDGGGRAIGLDVYFAIPVEQWLPGADRELAATFSEVSAEVPIVLSYDNLQSPNSAVPLYMVASAMEAIGYASLTLDPDGFARRQELAAAGPDPMLSFAARLAQAATRRKEPAVRSGRSLELAGAKIPLDDSGYMPIRFAGPAGTIPSVSMIDVLERAKAGDRAWLAERFAGKVVLIGSQDVNDTHQTPFYLAGGRWGTLGVEIQANAVATILGGRFLRTAPRWHAPLLALLAASFAAFAVFRLRHGIAPLALAAGAIVLFAAAVALHAAGYIVSVTPALLSLVFGAAASYGAHAATGSRRLRSLQQLFGRYVSHEVVRELVNAEDVPLRGVRRQITVMFTDLRNYTSYCEGRSAEQVVEELNEYLTDVTAEIKRHGGMVNKFLGDGVMALFGAPVAHSDHALRAVLCALDIVAGNDRFNARRRAAGATPLVIGIGLHTGDAIVGNVGTEEKLEYTAIGATVNVAARIEGENKSLQSKLLISQTTLEAAGIGESAEFAGEARLKGVGQPVRLYRVNLGNEPAALKAAATGVPDQTGPGTPCGTGPEARERGGAS